MQPMPRILALISSVLDAHHLPHIQLRGPLAQCCEVLLFFDQNMTAKRTSQSNFKADVHSLLYLLRQLLSLLGEREQRIHRMPATPSCHAGHRSISFCVCAGMLPWCPASMARLLAWHGRPFTTSSWRHPTSSACAAAERFPLKETRHKVRSHRVS